jgi:hypothetical protein
MNTLTSDIQQIINQTFEKIDDRTYITEKLLSLWVIPLNVDPDQLAKCILFLADGKIEIVNEIFESNFHGDPRDLLMYGMDKSKEKINILIKKLQEAEQSQRDLQKKVMDWAKFHKTREDILQFEREISILKGENYCIPWDLDVDFPWEIGVPAPHLLHNDDKTFLLYFLSKKYKIPNERGIEIVNIKTVKRKIAIVEFRRCVSAKIGSPNDEVLEGHPLYGKGLKYHAAAMVKNSAWIKEIESINNLHNQYNPAYSLDLNHYLIPFKDSTFECIATSFEVNVVEGTMKNALMDCCKRLFL